MVLAASKINLYHCARSDEIAQQRGDSPEGKPVSPLLWIENQFKPELISLSHSLYASNHFILY